MSEIKTANNDVGGDFFDEIADFFTRFSNGLENTPLWAKRSEEFI